MYLLPKYIVILFALIVIDYVAGLKIAPARGKTRLLYLMISIAANLVVLSFFKYYNFFNQNLTLIVGGTGGSTILPVLHLVLPVGLSFHTFQAMSYTIEVYRGNQTAERHLGYYALYVLFYPQLVAGPIERPQNLLPQFRTPQPFRYENFRDGLRQMAWGLFKKTTIADPLAPIVNDVYNRPQDFGGSTLLLATILFSIQIYCDFSGYSDIALGSAKCMGYNLMTNFRRPYWATSISEFWKRWHISLSTWFRDYLYIPLGGNRVSRIRNCCNLLLVFLISGLWHGANWTFVIWGALHGIYLMLEMALAKVPVSRIGGAMARLRTLVFVGLAWVFFRANSVQDAFYILGGIIGLHSHEGTVGSRSGFDAVDKVGILVSVVTLLAVEWAQEKKWIVSLDDIPLWLRWSMYFLLICWILIFGLRQSAQFIYFQF